MNLGGGVGSGEEKEDRLISNKRVLYEAIQFPKEWSGVPQWKQSAGKYPWMTASSTLVTFPATCRNRNTLNVCLGYKLNSHGAGSQGTAQSCWDTLTIYTLQHSRATDQHAKRLQVQLLTASGSRDPYLLYSYLHMLHPLLKINWNNTLYKKRTIDGAAGVVRVDNTSRISD